MLRRAVGYGPQGVLREIKDAKLLGRGGAAFPTAIKWEAVAANPVRPHYVVCNADESEPGTFKDRELMEQDPYALVEALTVMGYACGAGQGYIYIRGEYPLAETRLRHAVERARARGFLGDDVMGAGFAFDIEVRRGAGAYIAGEETALINSLEGKRAEPRNKPPFPAQSGLFGKPTAVNNVETMLSVLEILRGRQAFAAVGTENSTGTRLFCLSGCVECPGCMSTTSASRCARSSTGRAGSAAAARCGRCCSAGPRAASSGRTRWTCRSRSRRSAPPARRSGPGVVLVLDDTVDIAALLCADHPVLPRRVLRAVRAVPGRHGAPGGTGRTAGGRHAARPGPPSSPCSRTSDQSPATRRSAGSGRPRCPPSSPPSGSASSEGDRAYDRGVP